MKPVIFVSYSHRDTDLKDRVVAHLGGWGGGQEMFFWTDDLLAVGQEWEVQIEAAIDQAAVAVLLVSPDWIVSGFVASTEMARILNRQETDGLRVYPILLRSCDWETVPWLEAIQLRPRGARAVDLGTEAEIDHVLSQLAREIRLLASGKSPEEVALMLRPQPVRALVGPDSRGREESWLSANLAPVVVLGFLGCVILILLKSYLEGVSLEAGELQAAFVFGALATCGVGLDSYQKLVRRSVAPQQLLP